MRVTTGKREQWDFEGSDRIAVDDKTLEKDCDLRSQPVSLDLLLLSQCPEVLVFRGTECSFVSVEFSIHIAPTSSQNSHITCFYVPWPTGKQIQARTSKARSAAVYPNPAAVLFSLAAIPLSSSRLPALILPCIGKRQGKTLTEVVLVPSFP